MSVADGEVTRQVLVTQARAPYRLPASWYEPGVDVAMAAWIERFVSERDRRDFVYGRAS